MAGSFGPNEVSCPNQLAKQLHILNPVNCRNFETIKSTCSTLKRNPKMELSKPDLIKLLSHLEGELQARDVVIATLKCERLRFMIKHGTPKPTSADPFDALTRDNFAAQSSSFESIEDSNHRVNPLETLVLKQRKTLIHMAKLFKEAEIRHQKAIQDLMDKKCPHDCSGSVRTLNGIASEVNTRKEENESNSETTNLSEDKKTMLESSVDEKRRQKQIVLLLLAERRKILMKYIEERKRSEDLAQILSEEKSRTDSMAEGLEEESKKSLQMEAELEKQIAQFDTESQLLHANLLKEEKRVWELECELEKVRGEAAILEKQLSEVQQISSGHTNTMIPNRSCPQVLLRMPSPGHSNTMVSNVAKVVQPTATVSSVPVAGPTTGVARSIQPNHQSAKGMASVQSSHTHTKIDKRPGIVPNNNCPKSSVTTSGSVQIGSNGSTDKKSVVTRGVPPPVPPNKPVLPPKKDAVFKRVESNLCNLDTIKNKKDIKSTGSDQSEVSHLSNKSAESFSS